jgi:regulator of protease activity HflC (stomatin/prohibitin superfamily)
LERTTLKGLPHPAEVALRSAVGRNTIDYTMTDGRVEAQEQAKTALQELLGRLSGLVGLGSPAADR